MFADCSESETVHDTDESADMRELDSGNYSCGWEYVGYLNAIWPWCLSVVSLVDNGLIVFKQNDTGSGLRKWDRLRDMLIS